MNSSSNTAFCGGRGSTELFDLDFRCRICHVVKLFGSLFCKYLPPKKNPNETKDRKEKNILFVYVLTVFIDFSQAQAVCPVNCFKNFKNS